MLSNKILLFIFCFLVLFTKNIYSNNISVSGIELAEQNTSSGFINVKFNISWDNSWRNSINYDAAWVFVKYNTGDGFWKHATLSNSNSNHFPPAGAFIEPVSDGKGVFIYKSSNGTGSNNWSNAKIRWNYGTDNVTIDSNLNIKVIGIEMVHIPGGSFYLGDSTNGYRFYFNDPIYRANPFLIQSEDSILFNDSIGLWAASGFPPSLENKYIPAAYPKGYDALYCMKYEITQDQYADFLNTLTRAQQISRVQTNIVPTYTSTPFVMSNQYFAYRRNGIRCDQLLPETVPLVFYCDYNDNAIPGELADGQNIGCNYLSWADGAAYSDWSGLRPMTTIEFEKICRGELHTVPNEYAWGNTTLIRASGIINDGAANEIYSNAGANCNNAYISGPMRVGNFATSTSDRTQSGASYYGVMEMTGNLVERIVGVVDSAGRTFTGLTGDGELDAMGNANVNYWPAANALGSGLRTYGWGGDITQFGNTSFRGDDRYITTERDQTFGFRCVR